MNAHVTIALNEAQKARLETIAEARSETIEAIVSEAIQMAIDDDAAFRAGVESGLRDVEAGRTSPHAVVVARLLARRTMVESASEA